MVFGNGNADADLMFVGEAPGLPRGPAGPAVRRPRRASCWTSCCARSGSTAPRCSWRTSLKCRPPGNRDPQPDEIENCKPYLWKQVELIEPQVICTLGQLRDQAADPLQPRDHAGARQAAGRPSSAAAGWCSTRSSTRRRRCARPRRRSGCARTSPGCRGCSRSRSRQPQPSGPEPEPEPVAAQLDLFG